NRRDPIAAACQLLAQQCRRVALDHDLGLEIEPGREAEISMGRPREAVDAAMLAATIGVDRAVEGDVGGVVPGDDAAGGIRMQYSAERIGLLQIVPAVIPFVPALGVVAAA